MNLVDKVDLLNAAYERRMKGQEVSLDTLIDFVTSVCKVANKNNKNKDRVSLGIEFISDEMKETRGYSPELWNELIIQKDSLTMERERGFSF